MTFTHRFPSLAVLVLLGSACGGLTTRDVPDAGAGRARDGSSDQVVELVDAADPVDAGAVPDAGEGADAADPVDAGEPVDAGTPFDAGVFVDAGTPVDAGPAVPEPPALPVYAGGVCPVLVGGATAAAGQNTGFPSAGQQREFRILVPTSYDGTKDMPVLMAYHWLQSSSEELVQNVELETAVQQYGFIAVVPEHRKKSNGDREFVLDWPFAERQGIDEDTQFFDDLLACVGRQWRIDRRRIGIFGVSAGGFWGTELAMQPAAQRVASVIIASAGLGKGLIPSWEMNFTPPPVKFPAFVVWGGDGDKWDAPFFVNFKKAAEKWRDNLKGQGHFVVQCVHDQGHKVPPFVSVNGAHRFAPFWRFLLEHTWGMPAGTSPWQAGLPPELPGWCSIP